MRIIPAVIVAAAAALAPAAAAHADEVPVDNLQAVQGLSAEQKAAIASFAGGGAESAPAADLARPATTEGKASSDAVSLAASGSRRASFYRGSFLMWTRDNVDFGYNWSRVTWTSAYQQAGAVFPNIARNRGISKYYDTVRNDRFRAANTIGAGIVTPWGDVTVYTADFVHRLSVNADGAWSAWSD